MKIKTLKEKFKNNILVKPLYRKVNRKVSTKNLLFAINVSNTYKLDGNDINVKRQVVNDLVGKGEVTIVDARKVDVLPGASENVHKNEFNTVTYKLEADPVYRLSDKYITMIDTDNDIINDKISNDIKVDKFIQAERLAIIRNIPDTWLRVFPLPALAKETTCSIIFRCIVSQIGLASMLMLWTVVWTFAIHYFEGPYELQVSADFEKAQNQVVIDLATELRQITPVSPKWREAIEKYISDEMQLTMQAVSRGARAHPGQFWDLPGTFLFSVYVMTALGFGAPVPHTIWGRSGTIIYAFVAVPAHIYLMVNASTCLIVKLESCCCRRNKMEESINGPEERILSDSNTENKNCCRNSELMKTSKRGNFGKKILDILCLPCACRCVPLAAILYYAFGAVAFGVFRDSPVIDIFMFPLEFTTTGGLEHVQGYVRILYGIYVEGAMVLLSCALSTLKRHSSARINSVAETFRLFQVERL